MARSRRFSNVLLGILTAVPLAAYLIVGLLDVDGIVRSPVARAALVAVTIGVALLAATVLVFRLLRWRSVESRILHAKPTQHCRRCGYSSDGLDATRVDSGTLPFEHTTCPECGRPNPR